MLIKNLSKEKRCGMDPHSEKAMFGAVLEKENVAAVKLAVTLLLLSLWQ